MRTHYFIFSFFAGLALLLSSSCSEEWMSGDDYGIEVIESGDVSIKKGKAGISSEKFDSKVVGGNGWRNISAHEIFEDGSVSSKEYGENLNGYYGPDTFLIDLIERDSLVRFRANPAGPESYHIKQPYSFDEGESSLYLIDNDGNPQVFLKIIKVTDNHLYAVWRHGWRTSSHDSNVVLPRYLYVKYYRMSREELIKVRQMYSDRWY